MPATYEPIATTTLGSAAATITFSTIPATYTDLRLVFVGTSTTSGGLGIRFNSNGFNYSVTRLRGNGTAASSDRETSTTSLNVGNISSSTPSLYTFDVFSYAGSTNKTVLSESNNDLNGSGWVYRTVGLWSNTAAITSVSVLEILGYQLAAGSTATLYGIKNA
jgi:hypothetical protein